MKKNPKVDEILKKAKSWKAEKARLRSILLDSDLTEELKWYQPCYTYDGSNVAIIGGFKNFFTLFFFKGSLLKDPEKVLQKSGPNSQAARLFRFTSVEEVDKLDPIIRAYIREATEIEKAGLKVDFKAREELEYPAELKAKMREDKAFKLAFEALTPGKQRGYCLHFSAAKQSKTRTARIEKCRPLILEGKGIHDDYRKQLKNK